METDKLLTPQELAAELRVSTGTVKRWARAGRIPSLKPSERVIRFILKDVLEAITTSDREEMWENHDE